MQLPGLRRHNSLRIREHRRIYKYTLGLQLLGLSIICISVLLTIFELSSERNLGVGNGSRQMVDLRIARGMQLSTLHRNHLRVQGLEESNQEEGEVTEGSEVGEARVSEPLTFGQRLLKFFSPWVSSSEIKPQQLPDTDEVEPGCDSDEGSDLELPRVLPKCWKPPKQCATVEEMGAVAAGDTRDASLQVRGMIKTWMVDHGAQVVRELNGKEFCERKFVMGLGAEDGFGNNMYKLLGAAGLALMLNRSLIIGKSRFLSHQIATFFIL